MSAMTSALIVTLVGALVSTTSLVGPPPLPPEPAPPSERSDAEPPGQPDAEGHEGQGEAGAEAPPGPPPSSDAPPPPTRDTLPPVPFPLEQQRRAPPTGEGATSGEAGPDGRIPPPPQQRRSIVDLRDPFNRPPPRPRPPTERDGSGRLLMPDLKDPFAPGIRRVRSKKLDQHVPNDIRDPFRARAPRSGRPRCAETTEDGTPVQAPGKQAKQRESCQPSAMDLRDPFDGRR